MRRDYQQHTWDEATIDDCRQLIRLAVREDLDRAHDWTTVSLVPRDASAAAKVVARQAGVVAGMRVCELVLQEMNLQASWTAAAADGDSVALGQVLAQLTGNARDMLTAERILLNFLGRLSGIATLTKRFNDSIQGTAARLYDTRKTTPGWRRLEKYAVRCGGGHNHRTGLFDGILIKDNHLALGAQLGGSAGYRPAQAIAAAKAFLAQMPDDPWRAAALIEIELDRLDEFEAALAAGPDIVLLDNMPLAALREAVTRRDAAGSSAELEASGGVSLETIRAIAETGVDRISCGALTHSATNFDVALDWI